MKLKGNRQGEIGILNLNNLRIYLKTRSQGKDQELTLISPLTQEATKSKQKIYQEVVCKIFGICHVNLTNKLKIILWGCQTWKKWKVLSKMLLTLTTPQTR